MNTHTDRAHHTAPGWSATGARIRAYLATRPKESWLFFLAGALTGAILS